MQEKLDTMLAANMVTLSSSITQAGYAMDARHANASVEGSLANKVQSNGNNINSLKTNVSQLQSNVSTLSNNLSSTTNNLSSLTNNFNKYANNLIHIESVITADQLNNIAGYLGRTGQYAWSAYVCKASVNTEGYLVFGYDNCGPNGGKTSDAAQLALCDWGHVRIRTCTGGTWSAWREL